MEPSNPPSPASDASNEQLKPILAPEVLGEVLSWLGCRPWPESDKSAILSFMLAGRAFHGIGRPYLWYQIRLDGSGKVDEIPERCRVTQRIRDAVESAGTFRLVKDVVFDQWASWEEPLLSFLKDLVPIVRSLAFLNVRRTFWSAHGRLGTLARPLSFAGSLLRD
jgi:hypothetical protein